MLGLSEAIAQGALARVSVLRQERQTADAYRLLEAIDDPHRFGTIPAVVDRFSAQAVLRERAALERIALLMRDGRADALARARLLADEVMERVGPKSRLPALDGEVRTNFLLDFAVALSRMHQEDRAIEITQHFLDQLGLPSETARVVEHLRENPHARERQPQIATQLNNLAVRRLRLAYLATLGGDPAQARDLLTRARTEVAVSLELRGDTDDSRALGARLVSQSNLASVELEQAALLHDLDERRQALLDVYDAMFDVVKRSYASPAIPPVTRLARAGVLGKITLERALIDEHEGNDREANATAWLARIALQPNVDLWRGDADESLSTFIRFGEACRLSGDIDRARTSLQRSRNRLVLYRGPECAAVRAIETKLAQLDQRRPVGVR